MANLRIGDLYIFIDNYLKEHIKDEELYTPTKMLAYIGVADKEINCERYPSTFKKYDVAKKYIIACYNALYKEFKGQKIDIDIPKADDKYEVVTHDLKNYLNKSVVKLEKFSKHMKDLEKAQTF